MRCLEVKNLCGLKRPVEIYCRVKCVFAFAFTNTSLIFSVKYTSNAIDFITTNQHLGEPNQVLCYPMTHTRDVNRSLRELSFSA